METRSTGRRRLFRPEIETIIGELYRRYEIPSQDLASMFAPVSRTGKVTEGAVRHIANRAKEQPQA